MGKGHFFGIDLNTVYNYLSAPEGGLYSSIIGFSIIEPALPAVISLKELLADIHRSSIESPFLGLIYG